MDTSSDRFPGDRAPEPDEGAAEAGFLLIRAAMEQATDEAPALPDLVPGALVQGRRRRTRARVTIGAAVTGVVALGVLGAVLPLWSGGGGAEPARGWSAASQRTSVSPSPDQAPGPSPTPTNVPSPVSSDVPSEASSAPQPPFATDAPGPSTVHVEPSPGQSSMADLPAAERIRQEKFQLHAALLFGELLPRQAGPVHPVDLAVSRYQAGRDGTVFPIVFSVRPGSDRSVAPQEAPCSEYPDTKLRCEQATLPGGIEAHAVTSVADLNGAPVSTGTVVRFTYGTSTVALSVDGDEDTTRPAPVTADQLLAVAGNSRFLELVKYAAAHPMEPKEYADRVG
ncbi:hypothetical protein EDD93_1322 [Streptomyces sp. 840.1]|uniref:hypothetical protein n=1 Tax=Streptomyces sp. 840.1 TaxID=2485152 RepID=UPI000F92FC6B|nr:hypothetical protein [Streptomyces sp. 840.1]ROQ66906.1 hypothetical protein EDD93_1322 [Streptomyces sp. 840.1]